MQKFRFLSLAAGLLLSTPFSHSQITGTGDILVNPYYGGYGMNMDDESPAASASDVTYNQANTFGIRAQVLAVSLGGDAKLGFGLDVGNASDSFDWTDRSGGTITQRTWKRSTTFVGAFADAHVIQADALDVSLAAMIGYGFVNNTETPQSAGFGSYPDNRVMYNLDAGIAYFLIEEMAITLRAGIGTQGVILAGLQFKL